MIIKSKKIFYKDWVYMWLVEKRDYVKESTYANYSNIVFNHIIPKLGDYKLNELNLIKADKKSVAEVLIVPMVEDMKVPIKLASSLRNNGINTEIFLNNKKLKAKMKYADKLEIPYVIVVGEDEVNTGIVKIKNMKTGEQVERNIEEITKKDFFE